MNIAKLKATAREQIKGNVITLFLIEFICVAITSVASTILSFIPIGSVVCSVVISPSLTLSIYYAYLNLVQGRAVKIGDFLIGFDDFWAAFKVTFLTGLYTTLWSLLFIIPGIVKTISYSMAPYVLAENKGKSARECIAESMAMTEGHKSELLILYLSFFGWVLVGCLTFGIGFIWITPYMRATFANAYEHLKPRVITYQDIYGEPMPEDEVPQA